jgi:hypothetical protein
MLASKLNLSSVIRDLSEGLESTIRFPDEKEVALSYS